MASPLQEVYYKMWAGLNGFDPKTDLELGGVRIGMDCMNLVTVISRYMLDHVVTTVLHPSHSCTLHSPPPPTGRRG